MNRDEQELLIRSKSYIRYFVAQAVSLLAASAVLVSLHLLVALVMGVGLHFQNTFTGSSNDLLAFMSGFFHNPLAGLLVSILYLIAGLALLGVFLMFLNHYFKQRTVVIVYILLFMLTFMNISFFGEDTVPIIFFDFYLILWRVLDVFSAHMYFFLLWELTLLCAMLFVIKKFWHKTITIRRYMKAKIGMLRPYLNMVLSRKNLLIMLAASVVIPVSTLLSSGQTSLTFNDLLTSEFYGVAQDDFAILRFLTMLVYNGVPIYLLCHFLEKDSNERSIHMTIRMKYKRRWMRSVLGSGGGMVVCYVLFSLVVTGIVALAAGMDFSGYSLPFSALSQSHIWLLYLAVSAGKILELLFYYLVIFLIYCYIRKVTVAFLCLQACYFLNFIPTVAVNYLPTGIGSLARIREFSGAGLPFWQAAVFLAAGITLVYGYIRSIAHKKIFN